MQRLEDDYRYTKQKDIQKLLKQLSASSRQYYEELTGNNGPYNHLNILEALLAGISHDDVTDKPDKTRLDLTVKNTNGEEHPLESCLPGIWQQEKKHLMLLGDGGMGKTVSLIHFWETLLKHNSPYEQHAVPIFLFLHQYNTVKEWDRTDFIAKHIAWHYLGMKEISVETKNDLWQAFNTAPETGMPNIVLLLDGFNEITANQRDLIQELQELQQKSKGVQMVLTSRYEINFTWAEGFQTLELQPLNKEKVIAYLGPQKVVYPEDQRLQQILQNPMMLTLYANSNEIIDRYKNDKQFDFKPRTTTQGELLWNYLEAQIVKLARNYSMESSDFHYYKFLLRHFLPYIGFEMEKAGQFVFDENQLIKIVREGCQYFYNKEFIQDFPEYRSYLKDFHLKELEFAEEGERLEKISKALYNDLRLMKRKEVAYEFLHQNFRDYFAAVHILNELKTDIRNQRIPRVLTLHTLPVYIRRFVGQIAGEHYQVEHPSPPPTVIMQALDGLRGIFDEEKTGCLVWNIVNIFKDTRAHLGGVDFSRLNLLGTGLQNTFCYRREGNFYQSARFDGSLICEKGFLSQGHTNYVECVAFHPDGKIFISGSSDYTIKKWDLQSGECLGTFRGHGHYVTSVAFHPDGKTFVSGSSDRTIRAWDLKSEQCLATFKGHSSAVKSIAFHPDGKIFISGSYDDTIRVWDLKSKKCLATMQGHSRFVDSVSFHPDGELFISGSSDKTIKLWDLKKGECLRTFEGHSESVTSVAFHPKGNTFVSGSWDKTIKAWDLLSGECSGTFQGHNDSVKCIVFPDGKTFVSASRDKTIKAWDLQSGECLATFLGHNDEVNSIAFQHDRKTFVSASADFSIKAWELHSGECLATFQGYSYAVNSVAFHPGGNNLISGSDDKSIKAWDLHSGQCLGTFQGHNSHVKSVAFHPYGNIFISGSWDSTIRAWDLNSGECLGTFEGHSNAVECVSFHPDGKKFISGSYDKTIKTWDLQSGECLGTFEGHRSTVHCVAVHPDGKIFVSGSGDRSIKTWDLQSGECLGTFEGHTDYVNCVAFHPQGKMFISGSYDKTIRAWDLQSGECVGTFQEFSASVISVAFHPDGKTFISGSWDTIKVWDLQSGECLGTFKGQSSIVNSVAVHPDGNTIVSGSYDKTIKVWDLKSGRCLLTMADVAGLLIAGCTFLNLHRKTELSEEVKNVMRQYGAIFDEADNKSWKKVIQRNFNVNPT